jgi:two-component system chemotaxis response regulator CheB
VRRHDASSPTVPASRPGARASARVARPAAPLGAPKLGGPAGRGVGVITIGGSTGGPQALEALLSPLPADLPVPVLVVQHMPPTFTRLLAERLDSVCRLTVREAVDGEPVVAGEVLIAPGDVHLSLTRRNGTVVTHLDGRPPENHCRPAVDVLFRAVAEQYGARALGVVLTGMGVDGLVGARALLDAGSPTVVQDEETSVVWGMAGAVASAGLAQQVLPLTALPAVLMDAARVNRVPRSATPPAFRERVGP